MKQTAANLEMYLWETQSGPDINKPASKAFTASLMPGGVLGVQNVATEPMAGALVTIKPASLLPFNTLEYPWFGMDLEIYVPPADWANLARLELDIKRVIEDAHGKTIANVGDGSTQLNCQTGLWEIDKAGGGWVPTEFQPLLPPTWTALSFRHRMDGEHYSVLSTNWGGMEYQVPAAMQNITLLESNWGAVVAVQVQTEAIEPGTVNVYLRNVNLSLSDAPF